MSIKEFDRIILAECPEDEDFSREAFSRRRIRLLRNVVATAIMGLTVSVGIAVGNDHVAEDHRELAEIEEDIGEIVAGTQAIRQQQQAKLDQLSEGCRAGIELYLPGELLENTPVEEITETMDAFAPCEGDMGNLVGSYRAGSMSLITRDRSLFARQTERSIVIDDINRDNEIIVATAMGLAAGVSLVTCVWFMAEEAAPKVYRDGIDQPCVDQPL